MNLSSEQLRQWDTQAVWHAFTQMAEYKPVIFEEAHGCTLVDVDGREYIDGVASLWCNVHGHRHPQLDGALKEQIDRVCHVTNLGSSNSKTIELAARLVAISPVDLEHVFFSDSGATAVEVALKIAFQYWQQCEVPRPQKTRFAALDLAYHGDTFGAVSVGGMERFHEIYQPLLFDVTRLPAPDMYRLPAGVPADRALEHYLAETEKILAANHEQLAAVIVEPLVQGAAGIIVHPPGYLRALRELTRKFDILLIADEVAVGIGRTGTMFACEQEDVSPDLMCVGKGLSGGYLPVAATLATSKIYEAFLGDYDQLRTFFHGHTFGGNPLGAAVSLASLDVFESEQTLAAMKEKTARLAEHLQRISQHPHVGNVRHRGLMAGIELVQDKESQTPFPWQQKRGQQVCDHACDEGVWLRPLGDVVVIMPPLAISLEELDKICCVIERGIEAATCEPAASTTNSH